MSSPSSQQTLVDAIHAASPELLREILLRIAFVDRPCREAVEQEFLVQTVQSSFSRLSWDGSAPSQTRSSSTKRRRYECCARCEREYDVTKNDGEACRWHPVPEAAPTTGGNNCLPLPEVNVDAPASTKRKRYEMCEQCHKEFDTTKNSSDACVWHSGDLEVDVYGDFWADHDEDYHGEIDTEEMREEFPDGFIWEGCCEQRGSAKGCEVSEHVAAPFTAKKRRS
ncbi:hypothetical protein DIS24_g7988 [Lasiodiplodia hormozganensis]|uniref:C2H2-type domain-containing protein n=1 Tax=Lasiodiplodia hormozganensis TaxID=869390 RepID=A0AA40CPY7_9PEZI|nr:hypothetical protein DIS24_g7988 [Lasiodiplodia hormozganensis]